MMWLASRGRLLAEYSSGLGTVITKERAAGTRWESAALDAQAVFRLSKSGLNVTMKGDHGTGACYVRAFTDRIASVSADSAFMLDGPRHLAHELKKWRSDAMPLVESFFEFSVEQAVSMAGEMEDEAIKHAEAIRVSLEQVTVAVDMYFRLTVARSTLVPDCLAADAFSLAPAINLAFAVTAEGKDSVRAKKSSHSVLGVHARDAACRTAKRAVSALVPRDEVALAAGDYNLVLAAPLPALLMHEICGHLVEHDHAQASPWVDLVGSKIGTDVLTVIDDATLASGCGSYAVDDEGRPGGRTEVVTRGMLTGLLQDSWAGSGRAGHSRRATIRDPALARMSNTVVEPGTCERAAAFDLVRHGLFVEEIAGGMIDRNTGSVTLRLGRCRVIEEGALGAEVKGIIVMGDCRKLLSSVAMVCDDVADAGAICMKLGQAIPVGYQSPTVVVTNCFCAGGTRWASLSG